MDKVTLICRKSFNLFKRGRVYIAKKNENENTWTLTTADGVVVALKVTRADLDFHFTLSSL